MKISESPFRHWKTSLILIDTLLSSFLHRSPIFSTFRHKIPRLQRTEIYFGASVNRTKLVDIIRTDCFHKNRFNLFAKAALETNISFSFPTTFHHHDSSTTILFPVHPTSSSQGCFLQEIHQDIQKQQPSFMCLHC